MLKCWHSEPTERPSFSSLVSSISGFAETIGGYLDVGNYNPFTTNDNTKEGKVECHDKNPADKSSDRLVLSESEVATSAVMINTQSPLKMKS